MNRLRTGLIAVMKIMMSDEPGKTATEKAFWRLLSAAIFLLVVHVVYLRCTGLTLETLMSLRPDVTRGEQFTLSILIHYPDYMVLSCLVGVLVLLCLSVLVMVAREFAGVLHRRLTRQPAVQENIHD